MPDAATVDLNARSHRPELMDGDAWTRAEFEQCLRQLETINKLTGGYKPTLRAIDYFAARAGDRSLRVLDVGFGYGDTLRRIAWHARKRCLDVELTGIDRSAIAVELANEATPSTLPINYIHGDAFLHEPERPYDVVVNALFMHHLGDEQVVRMLTWMRENARLGFFTNDLHRHWLAHGFIGAFTRAFRFNRLVQHDAPLSVARSFRSAEWLEYAQQAGLDLDRFDVRWHWAFRYGVRYDGTL